MLRLRERPCCRQRVALLYIVINGMIRHRPKVILRCCGAWKARRQGVLVLRSRETIVVVVCDLGWSRCYRRQPGGPWPSCLLRGKLEGMCRALYIALGAERPCEWVSPNGIFKDDPLIVTFTVPLGLDAIVANWSSLITLDAPLTACYGRWLASPINIISAADLLKQPVLVRFLLSKGGNLAFFGGSPPPSAKCWAWPAVVPISMVAETKPNVPIQRLDFSGEEVTVQFYLSSRNETAGYRGPDQCRSELCLDRGEPVVGADQKDRRTSSHRAEISA